MRSIKNQTLTLEARIAAAELRTAGHGIPDEQIEAYMHVARVLVCFVSDWRDHQLGPPQSEDILRRLLERGIPEGEATRYAGMAYHEVRDELMSDPALELFGLPA